MSRFMLDYEIAKQRYHERLTEAELQRLYRQARADRARLQLSLLKSLGRWLIARGAKLVTLTEKRPYPPLTPQQ